MNGPRPLPRVMTPEYQKALNNLCELFGLAGFVCGPGGSIEVYATHTGRAVIHGSLDWTLSRWAAVVGAHSRGERAGPSFWSPGEWDKAAQQLAEGDQIDDDAEIRIPGQYP